MEQLKKVFGEFNLTWPKLIIFAVLAGVYSAIMAIVPAVQDTSFADIKISFEVWILFGIFIIMNSKSPKDSAAKCFIFFLISQPLIYLIQVPFSALGWQIMRYYRYWFYWTLLTIPMGYIGYYIKKDKWWGLIILTPILLFVGYHYYGFLREVISFFPNHLLSCIFCVITIIMYPLVMFNDNKIKKVGVIISVVILLAATCVILSNGRTSYNTTLLTSGGSMGVTFDDNYKVYLEDEKYGTVFIVYEKNIEDYMINASFTKTGNTTLILESPQGDKQEFSLEIERYSYKINKK